MDKVGTEELKPLDAWQRVLADDELAAARRNLSIHELRLIMRHGVDAFVELANSKPYDPSGPEVVTLHNWFYDNASPANWVDDGCRSENARDLLNTLAKAGFIVIPAPPEAQDTMTNTPISTERLEEILPCPFCGGPGRLIEVNLGLAEWQEAYVECDGDCGAVGEKHSCFPDDYEAPPALAYRWAIEAWNKRAPDRQQAQPTREEGWREPGPVIKPQIIADLREWAEFEQDGGNVEQGAAIDIILDWYDRQIGLDTSRERSGSAGYIDGDSGQYVGPFRECSRCGNDKLELRGKFWCCTKCGVSYGEHAGPTVALKSDAPAREASASTIAENATVEPAAHSLQTEWVMVPREPLDELCRINDTILDLVKSGVDPMVMEEELGEATAIVIKAYRRAINPTHPTTKTIL